jgi:L-2-hydroxyglutarate oxidase
MSAAPDNVTSPVMYDCIIIGGGIVGLSTAWQLQRSYPEKRILLLEKEAGLSRHQSGHNSGVIHAGIYYEPGSLKARFCKEGVEATIQFCRQNEILFEQCGKLLVSTDTVEHQRMLALFDRALANGLDVELLDARQLRQREPAIIGTGAIFLKTTGIVDYRQICASMAEQFRQAGGEIRLGLEAVALEESADSIRVSCRQGDVLSGRYLVACCGLMADRVARLMGIDAGFRVIPFRGEYYRLAEKFNDLVSHLIYPIPDPDLPFLGVHLTRMIDGSVTVGPNAVQGWKREGYGRLNFSLRDSWEMVSYAGFWRVLGANLGRGLIETRNSLWKRGYLKQVQKYCPQLELGDLEPWPAGIRAQAVLSDGTMVHDFLFAESSRSLHVCNAPSPAATSAIPIGAHICEKIREMSGGLD